MVFDVSSGIMSHASMSRKIQCHVNSINSRFRGLKEITDENFQNLITIHNTLCNKRPKTRLKVNE